RGRLVERKQNGLVVETQGICYDVLCPPTVLQRLSEAVSADGMIKLVTYHYLQVEPSRSIPFLVGFLNEVEKDFFEQFITVSGIGPRAAVKALNKPISEIARAIDDGNLSYLMSLPGIGQQRAKEIIAKLQGKVGKFGLIQDRAAGQKMAASPDIMEEALDVLLQLQYKKNEAREMIQKALTRAPQIKTVEDLLNEVYRQKIKSH
ncbi:MAG: Holliday junction branch migration protein RuvA, partial [Candidatus Omnitrophota bacterium]|nr:Holliday junction branch migration protein RuvA [Candidatus Omnitrophota bacterium]